MFETFALVTSAFLVGLSKAGFGAGVGILAVPLMTLAIGPEGMLGVLLPVLIVGDVLSLVHYVRAYERRNLAMLVPGCAAGVVAGAVVLQWFRGLPNGAGLLGGAIGLLCICFVGLQAALLFRRAGAESRRDAEPYRPAFRHGLLVGAAAGLTSTLSHAAGPIIVMFLMPQRLGQRAYVGTMLVYFLFGNLMKLGPFVWNGLVTVDTLGYLLYLAPAVLAGTFLGVWLNRRIPARTFSLVVYFIVFVTGLKLLAGLFTS